MVVVDNSARDRYRNARIQEDNQLYQIREDAGLDFTKINFCPRLRHSLSLLSQHKVGPLKQRVYLSDFQSSVIYSLPTDGSISSIQYPCNDRFVLGIPYFCEQPSLSMHKFIVRWSIITQCDHPDKPPEIILLGLDDTSLISRYGEKKSYQSHQSKQQLSQYNQCQTNTIYQERFWQEYVASEMFQIQCLTKWKKIGNENSSLIQYCVLANQLYDCYANFQIYKLKMSLKSVPSKLKSPPHFIQAYTQFKQLSKLSRSVLTEIDQVSNISIELLINVKNGIISNKHVDLHSTSNSLVHLLVIISIISSEEKTTHLSLTDNNVLLHLASVTTTFLPNANSENNSHKNVNLPGNVKDKNNKFVLNILNSKLENTTYRGAKMLMMLDEYSGASLNESMIDFVTYVRAVQSSAIEAYSCSIDYVEEIPPPYDNYPELFNKLHETFCSSQSNDNCLIDYQTYNHNSVTSYYIRFLLIDTSIAENSHLKYILTIEYNKYEHKKSNIANENEDCNSINKIIINGNLKSVYDEHDLTLNINSIDIAEINKLVTAIKITSSNAMKQFRSKIPSFILNKCNK